MYQFTGTHNAIFDANWSAQWSVPVHGKINGGLALVGDTIYANSFAPKTFAIDARTGKIRWARTASNTVMTTPIVDSSLVLIGTGNNDVLKDSGSETLWGRREGDEFLALHGADGGQVWSVHTVGEDMPSAALYDNLAVFANGDEHAYALDVRSGHTAWSLPVPGVSTMASAAIDGSTIFLVATRGQDYVFDKEATHVLAIDAKTGKELWRAPYGNSDCSPTVADGLVFVEGTEYQYYGPNNTWGWMGRNYVYALDERTGAQRWLYKSSPGFFTAVASSERAIAAVYSGGVLYQSLPVTNEFVAFDAGTGAVKWRFHTSGPVKMSAIVAHNLVIFGDTAGLLYSLNAKDGSVVAVNPFRKPFGASPPILAGKTVYIANGDSVLAIPLDALAG
jgi:outer membrane protein assembly factor BamB